MARFQRLPSSREPSIWDAYGGDFPATTTWGAPTYQHWYPFPFGDPSAPKGGVSPSERLDNPLAGITPPAPSTPAPSAPGETSPFPTLPPAVEAGTSPTAADVSGAGGLGGEGTAGPQGSPLGSSLSESDPSAAIAFGRGALGLPGTFLANIASMTGARGMQTPTGPMISTPNPLVGLLVPEMIRSIVGHEALEAGKASLADLSFEADAAARVANETPEGVPGPLVSSMLGAPDRGFTPSPVHMGIQAMQAGRTGTPEPASPEEGLGPTLGPTAGIPMPGLGFYSAPGTPAGPGNPAGYQQSFQNISNFGGPAASPTGPTPGFEGLTFSEGRAGSEGLRAGGDPEGTPEGPAPEGNPDVGFGGGVDTGGGGADGGK